jgi:hypothetical protein
MQHPKNVNVIFQRTDVEKLYYIYMYIICEFYCINIHAYALLSISMSVWGSTCYRPFASSLRDNLKEHRRVLTGSKVI